MKLPPRPERPSAQFEGRTPEEAVRLARRQFGHETTLRCWKIRSGGVLGFFAREAFVAGITPPPGAIKAVKAPRPAKESKKPPAIPSDLPPRSLSAAAGASLSQLVEETNDEVTLGADRVPAAVFSEVLAEAQAAVGGPDALVASHPPLLSGPPPSADNADAHLTSHPQVGIDATPSAEWSLGLTESLISLGVPAAFRPHDAKASLDGMARALSALPCPDPAPSLGGSVIVVVGGLRDARMAARSVTRELGLAPSDVMTAELTDIARHRLARRRSSNKVTVLVVEATVRSRRLAAVAEWIEKVRPDHVVGAVPATAKRSDVELWREQLGHIDTLALSRLADTATPGELMGLLPIAFLDGEDATPLRWVFTLIGTKLAGQT